MILSILIILATVIFDLSKLRGLQFKPLNKVMFFIFVANLLLLMLLGAKHVESPYIEIGQIATVFYFSYFIIILPLSSLFENSINEFYTQVKENKQFNGSLTSLKSSINLSGIVVTVTIGATSIGFNLDGLETSVIDYVGEII